MDETEKKLTIKTLAYAFGSGIALAVSLRLFEESCKWGSLLDMIQNKYPGWHFNYKKE